MTLYNINDNLITIECLYNKATTAVYDDNNIGEWFRTANGVSQGCLLSSTLFNIFLERIMADALEDHEGTISIGGRTITHLRFDDDIDGLAGLEQELVKLVNHLEASTAYGMQVGAEKTQLMTNNTNCISIDITIDNKKLETVRSFKYLGAVVSDEGSKPEVLSRIAQTTAEATKLKSHLERQEHFHQIQGQTDAFPGHVHILCACETWTITADIERRIQALEMRCFRKLLGISYRDYITTGEVKAWTENAIGPYEELLTSEKTQTEVVRARHTIIWTGQNYPTGISSRRESKRQTEETMERQHQRVDRPCMEYQTTKSREPRGVEEAGCKIYNGAPKVSQTTG